MHLRLEKVQDLTGFSVENKKGGEGATVKILTRALLTSDDSEFYHYSEQISNIFLVKNGIQIDNVNQFLVVIHQDLSADVYVNDFDVFVEIKAKRDIEAGEAVMLSDIADIRKVKFPEIEIKDTDKIIYCFKIGWRFGMFFDLGVRTELNKAHQPITAKKLDIERMELSIGELRRSLTFYHVYKTLESESQFEEMMKDGWFPFVEICAIEYKELSAIYQNKFDFENKLKTIIDSFDKGRIEKITNKWWQNEIFNDKKLLVEAGLNAYLQDNQDGYVNCIKNLWTEIEGILRKIYQSETGRGHGVRSSDLIAHIIEKGKVQSGSDYSLILPLPFLQYLQDVVFANFNVEAGEIDMSRNTSSHGVADTNQYTKDRALQLILVLDQIYFFYHA